MKNAGTCSAPRPSQGSPRPPARGFTLIEVLLTLALVGLLSGALAVGVDALLKKSGRDTAEESLAQTMLACRELALNADRTVQLRYDAKEKQFVWSDGTKPHTRAVPQTPPIALQFLQAQSGPTVLIGGQLVETREIPFVQFYRDGTCDAFRVQLQQESLAPRVLIIDPWTCTILPPESDHSS